MVLANKIQKRVVAHMQRGREREFKCCNWPMSSGSGIESGSWAATSCFKAAILYPPGGTSPGIISGKWKVDLGWSTSFKDRCQSEEAMCTSSQKQNSVNTVTWAKPNTQTLASMLLFGNMWVKSTILPLFIDHCGFYAHVYVLEVGWMQTCSNPVSSLAFSEEANRFANLNFRYLYYTAGLKTSLGNV